MRFGIAGAGTVAALLLAVGVTSCGDESRGSIEFLRYSSGRNVAAEAGGPIVDWEPVGIKVLSATGQPETDVEVRVVAIGGQVYDGIQSSLTGLTPLGDNVVLKTNSYGVVDVTIQFQYSAPIDGKYVIMAAYSGTASNQYEMEFTCFEATSAAPDCPS